MKFKCTLKEIILLEELITGKFCNSFKNGYFANTTH